MIDQQTGNRVSRIEATGGSHTGERFDGRQVCPGAPFCHGAVEFRHVSAERGLVYKPHHLLQALCSDFEIEFCRVSAVSARRWRRTGLRFRARPKSPEHTHVAYFVTATASRGAAAWRSRSLIASPKPRSGIGTT